MQPLTAEWIDKAKGDFATLVREVRARKQPNYDSACFHAQQCAEKYLKARLQEAGISFGTTHDLPTLLHLLSPIEPSWIALLPELRLFNLYSVAFRYPGQSADKSMAGDALRACGAVRGPPEPGAHAMKITYDAEVDILRILFSYDAESARLCFRPVISAYSPGRVRSQTE